VLTRAGNVNSPFLRRYLRRTFARIAVPEAAAFDFGHFRSHAAGRRRSAAT
jgi:hypothetical protein